MAVIQRKPEGTFIAYATAPGKTAADGDGGNGLFTSALLKYIMIPGLDISAMLRKVRSEVMKISSGKQVPWSESSLSEGFYFKEKLVEPPKIALQVAPQSSDIIMKNNSSSIRNAIESQEMLFWNVVKDSKSPEEFQAYLSEYPGGLFTKVAQLKLQRFEVDTKLTGNVEISALTVSALPKEGQTNSNPIITLRVTPEKVSKRELRRTIEKHDFFENLINWQGSYKNSFVEINDEVVIDNSTGLMWQKNGTSKPIELRRAAYYIKDLNEQNFNGYSDWRLPTLAELASLLKSEKVEGLYIDAVFDRRQKRLWSSDITQETNSSVVLTNFILHIELGEFVKAVYPNDDGVYWDGSNYYAENYVRAVRSSYVASK